MTEPAGIETTPDDAARADVDLDAIMARAEAAAPVAWVDSRGTFQSHYAADVPRLVAEVRDQREVIARLEEAVTALRHARDRQRDLRLGLLAANEALVEAIDAERDEPS